MIRLVRQGRHSWLRSLQAWAELARKLGAAALSTPTGATVVSLPYDPFDKLLQVHHRVADELVATQRHLVDSPTTVGGTFPSP